MIKVLLFDIDGVTSKYKRLSYLNYLSKLTGKSHEDLVKVGSPLIRRFDAGGLTLREFEKQAAKLLGIKEKEVRWREFYAPDTALNRPLVGMIKRLHKNYKTACLTNMDRSRYIYTKKFLYEVAFDRRFISSYLGMAKPDPRLYSRVLQRLNVNPSEVIFVDDNERNIISANKMGIKTIWFRNNAQLKKDLFKLLDISR